MEDKQGTRTFLRPADIERESMRILAQELEEQGVVLPQEESALIRRVIHATADFDFAHTLHVSPSAVAQAVKALRAGVSFVTDTNMVKAGLSTKTLARFGGETLCFMAEREIALLAEEQGTTRAAAAMHYAAKRHPTAIYAIGNAPTALLALVAEMEAEKCFRPSLIIGVPVGFVNVVESKTMLWEVCQRFQVPCIVAQGRKGGSTVAAAIGNALLYSAADTLDPGTRGWH